MRRLAGDLPTMRLPRDTGPRQGATHPYETLWCFNVRFASTLMVGFNFMVHLQGTLTGMAGRLSSISQAAAASAMAAESAATQHLDGFQALSASQAAAAAEVRDHLGFRMLLILWTMPHDGQPVITVSCATEGSVCQC